MFLHLLSVISLINMIVAGLHLLVTYSLYLNFIEKPIYDLSFSIKNYFNKKLFRY